MLTGHDVLIGEACYVHACIPTYARMVHCMHRCIESSPTSSGRTAGAELYTVSLECAVVPFGQEIFLS